MNGELSGDDKVYVSQVVARETGLSPQDAEKRVNDVVTQAKAAADDAVAKAKQAAETARTGGHPHLAVGVRLAARWCVLSHLHGDGRRQASR